jgi:hypothetical protein
MFPCAPVEADDLFPGLVLGHPQVAAVRVLPSGQRLREGAVEDLAEVSGLPCRQVFDQAEEVGPGRCQGAPDVVFGQTVELPYQRLTCEPQFVVQ